MLISSTSGQTIIPLSLIPSSQVSTSVLTLPAARTTTSAQICAPSHQWMGLHPTPSTMPSGYREPFVLLQQTDSDPRTHQHTEEEDEQRDGSRHIEGEQPGCTGIPHLLSPRRQREDEGTTYYWDTGQASSASCLPTARARSGLPGHHNTTDHFWSN